MRKLCLLVPVVLVLTAAACNSGGDSNGAAAGETGGGGGSEVGAAAGDSGPESEAAGKGRGGAAVASSVPRVGPQIVKTASLRLGIQHGSFEDKADEAARVATSLGGFVVDSSASQGSERRLVEGTLVLRVPASSYDDARSRLRELGKVEALDESGEDVSQQFVDLRARERQLQAVEAQLLELLQRADDVPAALAVQSQLAQVQLDLEQARGRLQYLEDQVAYATISVSLHELGVVPPNDGGFSIVDTWATAGSAFLAVVGWIFVGLAVLAPVFVLLGLGLLVARALRKRLAHA
ncbi:MAG TPA: DUF4349 domain-containing protein [Gaiellaceae bacterium]|nr:DUF4349 domain-containing protein [Gaiellaceae bacterium]